MSRLLLGIVLGACAVSFAADGVSTNGVRNPFWPMGYEGVRETISPNVREKPKPPSPAKEQPPPALTAAERKKREAERAAAEKAAKEAAEKAAAEKAAKEAAERAEAERKKREITPAHWAAAKAALKFGGRVKLREDDARENSSVVINGKVYADGDLISITHDSRRFTWRVEGLSDKSKLKLVRIRAKYVEKPDEAGRKSDKGANP
jgi:transcription elongation GreA/GreB family factor